MDRVRPVSDDEINAYLDGELTGGDRAAFEQRMAYDFALAARVRADLLVADALRAAQPTRAAPPPGVLKAARRLQRQHRSRRFVRAAKGTAIAASIFGLGWVANTATLDDRSESEVVDAAFVDDAREALRVAQIDAGAARLAPDLAGRIDRLALAADIEVPKLPATWQVTDAKVQAVNGRPSVVVTARSPALGLVTLVASPMAGETAVAPTQAEDGRLPTVYWQVGGTGYALIGSAAPDRLMSAAGGIELASRKRTWSRVRG